MSKRNNGEGSWGKKIINGYKYYTYRDSNGKTYYGKTQKIVKEKIEKDKAKPETALLKISPKTTFGEYISDWLLFKEGDIEQTTYEKYESFIDCMILRYKNHNLANTQIGSLSPRLFQQYLNTLAKQYSRASIIKIWSIIKQCVKFGELQNELPINTTAMVKVPIESKVAHKKKEITFLDESQADILYQTLDYRDKNNVRRYYNSPNAHALILILYSGMRAGELIALKWKNVDIAKKKIKVAESAAIVKGNDGKKISIDKVPKSKSSIRYIPLPNRAMEMIKYFKEHNASTGPDDYVCLSGNNTKLMRRNLNHTLRRMCKDAELPRLSVHCLRHSYGSMLLANDINIKVISELLGHANISITYDIYIGIKEEEKEAAIEAAFNKKKG